MLEDRRLYLVTGARPDLEDFLGAAVAGGVDIVQVRERALTDRELVDVLGRAREVTRVLGVPLVVNDRPDLAVLVGADLVHLGQDDIPVELAARLGCAAGLSTHTPAQIDGAPSEVAYIGVGPVHATPTKPGRPAVGVELVRYAAHHARVPWFAIGGIDESNVDAVVEAGATRIAVVRAIGEAADPEQAARTLRAALARASVAA